MDKKEKDYFKFLNDGVVEEYEFIPEFNKWISMDEQRKIAKKLENITKSEDK